jgi:hypothetical protein
MVLLHSIQQHTAHVTWCCRLQALYKWQSIRQTKISCNGNKALSVVCSNHMVAVGQQGRPTLAEPDVPFVNLEETLSYVLMNSAGLSTPTIQLARKKRGHSYLQTGAHAEVHGSTCWSQHSTHDTTDSTPNISSTF